MRRLSKLKQSFSFSFMSYDRSRQKSEGLVVVKKGTLRPASKKEDNVNADFMLNYQLIDDNKSRHFYQPTLMTFNDMTVTPN